MINIKDEFTELFLEFIDSYLYSGDGLQHIAAYTQQRQQGCRNFKAIIDAAGAGENVTESVLLQLLPYTDSPANKQKGAWIHISSELYIDIREEFKASEWAKSEEWYSIAHELLDFVCCCNDVPSKLLYACTEFEKLPYSKVFHAGMISPILNALRPDNFLLINNQSLMVINYLAKTDYTQDLIGYPEVNDIGRRVVKNFAQQMRQPGIPALRDDDLFDMFSHWLATLKQQYDFNFELTTKLMNDFSKNFILNLQEKQKKVEENFYKCSEEIGIDKTELQKWVNAIDRKGQAILQGPPGTGKTFIAKKLAEYGVKDRDGFSELVQFHPSYSYEDFIQGIRPKTENGQLIYSLVPGRFLEFCKKAESYDDICVLIIDEINRANLSNVFGELMYLLEYRDEEITLAGSNEPFSIPKNVRIIGTMNTADRSIALVDHALRRRFAFIKIYPNYEVLQNYHEKSEVSIRDLISVLQHLNETIDDPNYQIGISFFMIEDLEKHIEEIWTMEIEPYLEEYFYDQPDKVEEFRWNKVQDRILQS